MKKIMALGALALAMTLSTGARADAWGDRYTFGFGGNLSGRFNLYGQHPWGALYHQHQNTYPTIFHPDQVRCYHFALGSRPTTPSLDPAAPYIPTWYSVGVFGDGHQSPQQYLQVPYQR